MRIKQSKALKKRLEVIVEDAELGVALFRCPSCGESWQSGREWNFANEEYLFRVPQITPEAWQLEHYRQPVAMMIYSAVMADHHARTKFSPSQDQCRAEGCEERASTLGFFCRKHQIEELQKVGRLPKPPVGRIFPPYYEEKRA